MTAVAAISPFVFLEDYVQPKEHEKSDNSTPTVRLNIEKFDIYEDYAPGIEHAKSDNSAGTLSTHPADHFALSESAERSLLTSWVETDRDRDDPAQAPSWLSTVTAPLAGIYNAAIGPARIGQSDKNQPVDAAQRIAEVAARIQRKLDLLDQSICSKNDTKLSTPDEGRKNAVRLTVWDSLRNLPARTQGAVTALLDTTGGVATGVAIGGVATTGILGLGFGAAALSAAVVLVLDNLRNLLERADSLGMKNLIEEQMPAIKKDLDELDALVSQEQHRHTISERLMTTMMMRYDRWHAMEQAARAATNELRFRAGKADEFEDGVAVSAAALAMSYPAASQGVVGRDGPTCSTVLTQIVQTRDSLYNFIAALVQRLKTMSERLFLMPQAREAAADKIAEEAFRNDYQSMLYYMSVQSKDFSGCDSGAAMTMLRMGNNGGASTNVTHAETLMDIKIGRNLTQAIFSSGPNCGLVEYMPETNIPSISKSEYSYVVPSNLTTVRSIALYLDAQAIENAQNPIVTSKTFGVSQGPDGSYTVQDPERKLFSFLASAPTACAHISGLEGNATSASLMDTSIGRMTIADYRSTFPGGTNQMEFEATIDQSGANVLTVRFVKQHDESMLRPDQSKVSAHFEHLLGTLATGLPSTEMPDFTGMSTADVRTYLDNMTVAVDQQMKLFKEDQRHLDILKKWEHPALAENA